MTNYRYLKSFVWSGTAIVGIVSIGEQIGEKPRLCFNGLFWIFQNWDVRNLVGYVGTLAFAFFSDCLVVYAKNSAQVLF
jgi:hypothetical protein